MSSGHYSSDANIRLFARLGIELLKSNRYQPASLGTCDVTRTRYYRRNRIEFDSLTLRYGGALQSGEGLPLLEVRRVGGLLGYGLFTMVALEPGDLVGEYLGQVRRPRRGRPLPGGGFSSDYAWGFPGVRRPGRDLEIDAGKAGGLLRFANHDSETAEGPSAEPEHFPLDGRWHIVFIARRQVEPGEQITVDYGEAYWSGGDREHVDIPLNSG